MRGTSCGEAPMAISISGSNAISGLSGMDTDFDEVLAKLKEVESTQLNRLEAWKDDWNLRYEAFGEIIGQVQTAQNVLSNLANKNNFVSKNVTSSDENVVTAVASASAQDVQHNITVNQMASNAVWANMHIYDSKTEIINTSGETQTFSYTYAGTTHTLEIAPKTTLESFASLINGDVDNPGVKVSLVQTGSGYVFQMAGTSTGEANDLVINDADLVGMTSAGATSSWQTNGLLALNKTITDPNQYAYDLLTEDGNWFTVSITGDKTNEDLVNQINAQTGRSVASLDQDGNLQFQDVKAVYRRDTEAQASRTSGSTTLGIGSNLKATLSADTTVSFTVNDGAVSSTHTLELKAGATMKEALLQIAQAAGSSSAEMTLNSAGGWEMKIANVSDLTFSADVGITHSETTANLGTRQDDASELSASVKLTFDKDMLSQKLGGDSADGSDYEYTIIKTDGTTQKVTIANTATYDDLLTQLGGTTSTDSDGNTVVTLDDTENFYLSSGLGGGLDGLAVSVQATTRLTGMDGSATIDATQPELSYSITLNGGETVTVDGIASGSSIKDIYEKIAAALDGTGATATLVDAEGNAWDGTDATGSYYLQVGNVQSVSGPGISGQVASSSVWNIQRAANARYTVDNWPMEMESASNSVSDVIEGVVFSIQDTGTARISVSTDIASVEESIQTFLDAVNSVLLTIQDYTKYDETKETTSSDPDDIGNDNYSASQLTSEKGGLLQGNYGVQLFASRFSGLLGSSPPGFQSRTSATDLLSGDVLANLANMGIKTDTDENSDTYGLLVIAPESSLAALQQLDQENYEDMINNNLEAVVDFFCSSGTGASSSADFRYNSHVAGITKGGTYDVSYSVDADGNIEHVYVGGVEATRDTSQPGYYYSVASGDARGLSLSIDDLSEGAHSGQIRIKEGLIPTVNSFLKSELTYNDVNVSANATDDQIADAIYLKSQNGALMVLQVNYKTIMENIEDKISKEQDRLELWESRQKTHFANLETLLKQYSTMQDQLETQLKQLSSSSD